jgi:hypothetical protein
MKTKPPSPTALKVPEWLLREAEGYIRGSDTRHAVMLAMMALGAQALRADPSLLVGAIELTRKPRKPLVVAELASVPVVSASSVVDVVPDSLVDSVVVSASSTEGVEATSSEATLSDFDPSSLPW